MKPNVIKPGTAREAVYNICKAHPQGLTGDQIFAKLPDFSREGLAKNVLQMVTHNIFLYREQRRNPATKRMCYYYKAYATPNVPRVGEPPFIRLEMDESTIGNFVAAPQIGQVMPSATLTVGNLEHPDRAVPIEPVDVLEFNLWKSIHERASMETIVASYRKILNKTEAPAEQLITRWDR